MLDLILAIVLSAVIAIFMRLSEQKKQQDIAMLAVNYLTCTILAATAVLGQTVILTSPRLLKNPAHWLIACS